MKSMNASFPTPPTRRIGLFGGTFDPVHHGHLHLAKLAREAQSLDQIRFIPCRISPHKGHQTPGASGGDRLAMLQLAIQGIPWAAVDDREINSACPSFSYLTAQAIAAETPNARLFWIMGADQWQALPHWKNPETLASYVDFIVLARDGRHPTPREGFRLHVVHGGHPASATQIRKSFAEGNTNPAWLPQAVACWIKDHQIYLNRI